MQEKSTVISIDIPSTDHTDFTLKFNQSAPHCVWLDWGDGSQRDSFSEEGLIDAHHTYADPGEYDISMFAVDDGKIKLVCISSDIGYRNMVTKLVVGDDVVLVHDNAFSGCENLEELEFLGEETVIGLYAFSGCVSLESAILPTNLGTIPEGIFFGCTSLKEGNVPPSVSIIGANAFYGCYKLRDAGVYHASEIGDYAFHGCRKLTILEFGKSIKKIGEGAFDSCTNIRSIILGSVTEIGDRAFCNCRSMSKLTIPATVTSIGDQAFYNCRFVQEIKMASNKPPILVSSSVFPHDTDYKILVPRGTKRDYAYATNWNVYLDKIQEG